jgi:acyl carrier protein
MAGIVAEYAATIGDLDPLQVGLRQTAAPELLRTSPEAEPRATTAPRAPSPRPAAPASRTPPPRPAVEASPSPRAAEVTELKAWMVAWIAEELGVDPRALSKQMGFSSSSQTPFSALGVDSVTAIQFVAALEDKLACPIPASALWDHDNVEALALHLLELAD